MKLWHRIRAWLWPGWIFVRGTAFRRPKDGYVILTPEDRVCLYNDRLGVYTHFEQFGPTQTVLDVLESREGQ